MNPKMENMQAKVMMVTPELASEWIGHNVHNRGIRERHVENLTEIIKRGEWRMNGDAIKFAKDGTLIDGQHRLLAIGFADIAVEVLVVRGLDMEVQETVDMGVRRNLADALKLRGEMNCHCLAATLSYFWRMENGYVRNPGMRPTIAQAIAMLEKEPHIRGSIPATTEIRKRFRMSPAMTAAVWYELNGVDNESCWEFFDKLNKGSDLSEHDPILHLRRWLEKQLTSGVGTRASVLVTHAMIVKAWNLWRSGQEVNVLSWRPTGKTQEQFPEAQ